MWATLHQAHGQPGIGHRGVHLFIRKAARDLLDEVYAGLGPHVALDELHGLALETSRENVGVDKAIEVAGLVLDLDAGRGRRSLRTRRVNRPHP